MAWRLSSSEVKLSAGADDSPAIPDEETPFRIAVLGDFGGRSSRSGAMASRHPVKIDRDNFDEVLSKIEPEVSLPIELGPASSLRFSELDDFHPDRLFERAALFDRLREARLRVLDPAAFAAAAEESRAKSEPRHAEQASEPGLSVGAAASSLAPAPTGGLLCSSLCVASKPGLN